MSSLWKQDRNPPTGTPFVAGERHDVIVVGAGITGLSTALQLAREGLDVAVVEARDVGALASGSNTGKVSLLQGSVLSTLRRHHPASLVRAYVDANRAGADWLTGFATDAGVPFTRRTAFSYAQTRGGVDTVAAEAAAAHEAGLPVRRVADDPVDGLFPVLDAVALDDQVAIDPYRVAVALAEAFLAVGGTLHTGVRVRRSHAVPHTGIVTDEGPAFAHHVVLATGTPIADRGLYFAKTRGLRSYCVAFTVPGDVVPDGLYLSVDGLSVDGRTRSIRSVTDDDGPAERAALIVGGNGHPVGRADGEQRLVDDLVAWTRDHFRGAEPVASWSAQDYESHDLIPFVGAMPRSLGRIRFATGFGKWGLTNGPAAALRLSAEIRRVAWRDRPDWMNVIARRFTVPADVGRGAAENVRVGWEAVSGWVGAQRTPVPVPRPGDGEGVVATHGGRPIGVSTVAGVTRAVSAVCPHLGGVLTWNDAECTWDCPLHASRFRPDGARIEGPATRDLDEFPRSPGEPVPSEAPPAR
jgi:glycine/D-amino acid oxidase-like deaminating enzyme/nitrite reductase/ring-hydroxylating ferredoxin subunit